MRKYLLHVLIISFVFFLTPTIQAAVALGETIEARRQAVKKKSDDAKTLFDLGVAYLKSGMYKEAIEVYKRAIFINTGYIDAYNNLGNAYGKLGMYKEAIEVLKVAIKRDPDHAMSYYNLGLIYNLSNDKDSALEQYEILKDLDYDLSDKLFRSIKK